MAAVTAAVESAYARFGTRAGAWLTEFTRAGGRVACGAGCYHCCDMPIRVSLAEALVVARALTPAQVRAVRAHARKVARNARAARDDDEYVQGHREDVSYCPLLDRESGQCTQYAVRPTRCRDTFSAMSARFCTVGVWEGMNAGERRAYRAEVRRTPGTDGETHFIAPLEEMSEPVWTAASRAMRRAWGVEVWGDFWTLTTLALDEAFMAAVGRGDRRAALTAARTLGLHHPVTLEFA
ncbi:protein of unknown function UPF0153 [Deinococcus maricopensis DSM 21211]|uniref:Zinc/iron-chelating domain-containing protein n=1 Tax=Deinococcus maricopensis (strain DSM 21211 / LMG 22137 / NRRL B-23946 / LB-34) TaxID=709986 RepID=E8U765_DEIML|nr:protein of unknown function UPF0153 [Deinococcus maricopensis DSM 21211]